MVTFRVAAEGTGNSYQWFRNGTAIAALAITTQGRVYAWRVGGNGQLGQGDKTNRLSPVSIPLASAAPGGLGKKGLAGR